MIDIKVERRGEGGEGGCLIFGFKASRIETYRFCSIEIRYRYVVFSFYDVIRFCNEEEKRKHWKEKQLLESLF